MNSFVGHPIMGLAELHNSQKLSDRWAFDTRSTGLGISIQGAFAISPLFAKLARAATLPTGCATIDPATGITSANVLAFGPVEVTHADGSEHHSAQMNFAVLRGDALAVELSGDYG